MKRQVLWQQGGQVSLMTPAEAWPDRVDVAVLGGGLSGLSAALQMAESGLSVLVVEKDRVGDGASGRNGGQVLTGVNPSFAELIEERGEDTARSLYGCGVRAVDEVAHLVERLQIACDFHRGGHLAVAVETDQLEALSCDASLLGSPIEMLDRTEIASRLGFSAYAGGLSDPRSATVNPYALTVGVGHAARERGVTIIEQTAAQVERAGALWRITGASRPITADRVLAATNAFLPLTVPALKLRVRRVFGTVIATAPVPADILAMVLPGRPAVFEESERFTHFQRTADGRLIFGGRAWQDASSEPNGVVQFLRSLITPLARVPVAMYWTGPLGVTGDGLPTWGESREGLVYLGGYSGHGVALSAYLGGQVGRYLATGKEPGWPRALPPPFGFSDRTARRFRPPSALPKRLRILR